MKTIRVLIAADVRLYREGLAQVLSREPMLAVVGTWAATVVSMAGINVTQFLRPMVFVYFYLFFV